MLVHVDLESGIGGFALAAGWAGFKTICFVEIDDYCQRVLRKHWPDVPIVEDIRDVKAIKEVIANTCKRYAGDWAKKQESQKSIDRKPPQFLSNSSGRGRKTMPRNNNRLAIKSDKPIIVITAGVPCQPASVAGKRKGKKDDRWLWPETFDVVRAIKPDWCLFENVPGILALERGVVFDNLLSELEGIGYEVQTFVIPACAVNAPHRRDRVWIVAHSQGRQNNRRERRNLVKTQYGRQGSNTTIISSGQDVANPSNDRCPWPWLSIPKRRPQQENPDIGRESQDAPQPKCQGQQNHQGGRAYGILDGPTMPDRNCGQIRTGEYWCVEPELGRVAHGIPNRVDRLKCLGNAIVPQVAYQILKEIAEIEM
jgi:DNA (cytosine-5)-methyltransferase 1